MGEGKIDFDKVFRSIADAGFKHWAVLETDSPSHNIDGDMKRNLTFIERLLMQTPKG